MGSYSNWAKNLLFLLVYMLSGGVLVLIIDGLVSGTELMPFNTTIEQAMVAIRTPMLTNVLVVLTNIGSPFVLSAIACFIAIFLLFNGRNYDALLSIAAMFIAIISFTVLKEMFQISRPSSEIFSPTGWSFPSGHATIATSFFFTMAHTFFGSLKTAKSKVLLVLGSILGAALISFSRLYLGAHWALDILAGVSLGLATVSFVILIFNIFSGSINRKGI